MKFYDYIFFTFYRFWEKAPSKWWSEWKAGVTLVFLWIAFLSILNNVYIYLFRKASLSDFPYIALLICGGIGVFHHFLYTHNDKWKERIVKFKNIDKKKDILGILIILLSTILILSGLFYSIRLLSYINR